jgi:hypothetical protein
MAQASISSIVYIGVLVITGEPEIAAQLPYKQQAVQKVAEEARAAEAGLQ